MRGDFGEGNPWQYPTGRAARSPPLPANPVILCIDNGHDGRDWVPEKPQIAAAAGIKRALAIEREGILPSARPIREGNSASLVLRMKPTEPQPTNAISTPTCRTRLRVANGPAT